VTISGGGEKPSRRKPNGGLAAAFRGGVAANGEAYGGRWRRA